ncbi:MAG: cytochrome d ubiquinol oxidase subunit II [Chitinophagaceae bacterium]|nr:cytochrome d ubiquinol oxidase subunit II [Chitinophagaceae bacterium]
MLNVVMIFLWASLLLYLLMGGADFGAGILELFTKKENRPRTRYTLYKAIGPIWEANHMWLIIAIVILFVGFPEIYTTMSVSLHIPLTIMLLGIIARGTAFAFRHHDPVVDDMQKLYNGVFVISSVLTPFSLGVIAGSAVSSTIDTEAKTFADAYIFSWLNAFSVAVGLFTVTICGYLAAVYLIGETDNATDRKRFIAKAKTTSIAAFICGTFVFITATLQGIPLANWIFGSLVGVLAISLASLSFLVQWYYLYKNGTHNLLRLLAGFQVSMILLTITYRHFPNIVLLKNGKTLSLLEHHGHEKTIESLGWALIIGSIFILPALFYLLYSFRHKPKIIIQQEVNKSSNKHPQ